MTTGICRTYRTEGMPRTQLGTECMAFASKQQNALCVNGMLADIARRQFVPTNCPCSPRQTNGEIITLFSSVSIQELRDNESSIMINFQRNLYEQI
ncbi:hypothetical protein ABVC71_02150 [Prevotella amnii]|uniref:hypothetical protein n=1 Tax=Prevotella amnii TaxID=419005 RepID=UPI003369BF30